MAQFLADAHPSHLVPATSAPGAPLARARAAFFVDAWFSKCGALFMRALTDGGAADELVRAVAKEVEPLLADAGPFFGGSERLTLAEVSLLPPLLCLRGLCACGKGG